MRQPASDVIEAESFLKKHSEALPVGMGELPTTALTEPTHIMCTSLISAANNNSSALSLSRPSIIYAHTHIKSSYAFGWRAPTPRCTTCIHTFWYVISLQSKTRVRHELTSTPLNVLSAWRETSVRAPTSCPTSSSWQQQSTRQRLENIPSDSGGTMQEGSATILQTGLLRAQKAFQFSFQHILSLVKIPPHRLSCLLWCWTVRLKETQELHQHFDCRNVTCSCSFLSWAIVLVIPYEVWLALVFSDINIRTLWDGKETQNWNWSYFSKQAKCVLNPPSVICKIYLMTHKYIHKGPELLPDVIIWC